MSAYFYTLVSAGWFVSYVSWPIIKRVAGIALTGIEQRQRAREYIELTKSKTPLSPLEKDILVKLKNGEIRMYEVAAPSEVGPTGLTTRYLVLDNRVDDSGPVYL